MLEQELGSHVATRPAAYLLAARPTLYLFIILGVVLGTFSYRRWADSIFACPATGYSSDYYLAYCNGPDYGEYEHGAFWFDLEPSAVKFASNAEVLFLGNSRMQRAFSNAATADWFSSISANYYLLGFGEYENAVFTQELLRKLQPEAKIYVINIDGFFDHIESPAAKTIMHDDTGRFKYELKRIWQLIHKPICTRLPAICRDEYAIFRSRETGAWRDGGAFLYNGSPVSYDPSIDENEINSYATSGTEFLSRLPITNECVILTMVPTVRTKGAFANAIAVALRVNFIAPELEGLQTFDGSHLDHASAERWSEAFLQAAARQIRQCRSSPRVSR